MASIRLVRSEPKFAHLLSDVQNSLRKATRPTQEERAHLDRVKEWTAASVDVLKEASRLAGTDNHQEAERIIRDHNAKKPRRSKGARRTVGTPRMTEVESELMRALIMRALRTLKPGERADLIQDVVQTFSE